MVEDALSGPVFLSYARARELLEMVDALAGELEFAGNGLERWMSAAFREQAVREVAKLRERLRRHVLAEGTSPTVAPRAARKAE